MYQLNRKGETYGALIIVSREDPYSSAARWICRCKCGNFRTVEESRLLSGRIATCPKCELANKQAKL